MIRLLGVLAVVAGAIVVPAATAGATGGTTTTLVSVSTTGGAGNGASDVVAVTPDGRFVLFNSKASNLVPGDTNGKWDVFVRNVQTGHTYRVSVGPHLRQANADCYGTAISPDGRFVEFGSKSTDLIRSGHTNGVADVFVRDRQTGTTVLVSVPSGGGQFTTDNSAGVISDDGRYVAFTHGINGDVWHTYVRDRSAQTTHVIDAHADSQPAAISADGRYLALYIEDHHGVPFDLDLRDRPASTEVRVPSPDSPAFDAVMTPDAKYVAFSGLDGNGQGWDAFRWRRGSASTTTVRTGGVFTAQTAGISSDGRYVAFSDEDPAVVSGDTNANTDMFRRDLTGGGTIRVSLSAAGAQLPRGGDGPTGFSGVPQGNLESADGSIIAFGTTSQAVPADTNSTSDVYIRGPL